MTAQEATWEEQAAQILAGIDADLERLDQEEEWIAQLRHDLWPTWDGS